MLYLNLKLMGKLMLKKSKIAIAVGVLSVSNIALADNFNARIAGMGGVGVASSKYDTASSTNPALLTNYGEKDDIAIILPSVGLEASDKNDVIDAIDDIPDFYDDLEDAIDAGDTSSANDFKDKIISRLIDVDGSPITVDAGVGLSVSIPNDFVAIAVSASGNAELAGVINFDANDESVINSAIFNEDSDELENIDSGVIAIGAVVQELSVSFAKEFEAYNYKYSIGISPKYQSVETFLYQELVSDADQDDFDSNQFTTDDSNFNIDIGAALFLNDNVTIGLNIRDLISQEYDTTNFTGISDTYELNPLVTTGIAYDTEMFTIAFDIDLTKTEGYSLIDDSQMARIGAEFDAWGWAQIRLGYRHDIKDTRDDVATIGLAFSPFNVFHIGLTASAGENETYGAGIELKATF
jgi:hypothetical protein